MHGAHGDCARNVRYMKIFAGRAQSRQTALYAVLPVKCGKDVLLWQVMN